uniref:Uncharacterized protein n=1 Tax=Arundo donax TaxID=35708 RepID=A0A0A9A9D7_ARUDO
MFMSMHAFGSSEQRLLLPVRGDHCQIVVEASAPS